MAIDRCRTLLSAAGKAKDKELAITLGCVVTDLKAWLSPDIPSVDEANAFLSAHDIDVPLHVHGMARLAWWSESDELIVFANGGYRISQSHDLQLVRKLCATRQLDAELLMTPNRNQLLSWLLDMGAIDVFLSRTI
jgi:hypothetical protein